MNEERTLVIDEIQTIYDQLWYFYYILLEINLGGKMITEHKYNLIFCLKL